MYVCVRMYVCIYIYIHIYIYLDKFIYRLPIYEGRIVHKACRRIDLGTRFTCLTGDLGTQFTCFTSTKIQILTPKALLRGNTLTTLLNEMLSCRLSIHTYIHTYIYISGGEALTNES
jgi:hypothetical protein